MTLTVDQMVQREINCCLSSLVATLAANAGLRSNSKELEDLVEQAVELAAPVLDYEEAARQAGYTVEQVIGEDGYWIWRHAGHDTEASIGDGSPVNEASAWECCCRDNDIDPYEWEVYEHWSVSNWLAEKLLAEGEKVDTDFAGLNVWARTTTGQMIAMDGVMQRIHAKLLEAK